MAKAIYGAWTDRLMADAVVLYRPTRSRRRRLWAWLTRRPRPEEPVAYLKNDAFVLDADTVTIRWAADGTFTLEPPQGEDS